MITTKTNKRSSDVAAPPSSSNQGEDAKKQLLGFSFTKNNIKYVKLRSRELRRSIKSHDSGSPHLEEEKTNKKHKSPDRKDQGRFPTPPVESIKIKNRKFKKYIKTDQANNTHPDIQSLKHFVYDVDDHQNALLALLRDLRPFDQPQLISYSFVVKSRLYTRGGANLTRVKNDLPFLDSHLPLQSADFISFITAKPTCPLNEPFSNRFNTALEASTNSFVNIHIIWCGIYIGFWVYSRYLSRNRTRLDFVPFIQRLSSEIPLPIISVVNLIDRLSNFKLSSLASTLFRIKRYDVAPIISYNVGLLNALNVIDPNHNIPQDPITHFVFAPRDSIEEGRLAVNFNYMAQQLLTVLRDLTPEADNQAEDELRLVELPQEITNSERNSDLEIPLGELPLQSADTDTYVEHFFNVNDYYVKLIEDVGTLMHQFTDASNTTARLVAATTFVKLRIKGSLSRLVVTKLTRFYEKLFCVSELQSADEEFAKLRFYLDSYSTVKTLPIFTKLYKLVMYCLSLSIFEPLGLSLNSFNYNELEAEAIKKKFHMGPDFIHCVCDTLLFLGERGFQAIKQGRLDPIFHSAASYSQWFERTKIVLLQSKQLNDPALFGFTEQSYLGDLDNLIEQGDAIKRYAKVVSEFDAKSISYYLGELKLAKASLLTLKKACSTRQCPFGVLLYGDSGIGKSSIADILYLQYAAYFNLPNGPEFRFSKSTSAKYWDNFRTQMWCLVLDEVGFKNPDKAPQGDTSVDELLQIMNYVPFCPDQASLDQKGKTPFLGKLVIATSNTKHFNARHYFSAPSAAQRRLPYVITCRVRDEYSKNGQLDPGKTELDPHGYPDFWTFTVEKVLTKSILSPLPGSSKDAGYEEVAFCKNITELMIWFNSAIQQHDDNQKTVDTSMSLMRQIIRCEHCKLPEGSCSCNITLQSADHPLTCLEKLSFDPDCMKCGFKDCKWASVYNDICLYCGRCSLSPKDCIYCDVFSLECSGCGVGTENLESTFISGRHYLICPNLPLQAEDYIQSDPLPIMIRQQPQQQSKSYWNSFRCCVNYFFTPVITFIFLKSLNIIIYLNLCTRGYSIFSDALIYMVNLYLLALQCSALWVIGNDPPVRELLAHGMIRYAGYITESNYRRPKVVIAITIGAGIVFGLQSLLRKPKLKLQSQDDTLNEPKELGNPKPNVYHHTSKVLQPFEFGRVIPSQAGLSDSEYCKVLSKNLGIMMINHSRGFRRQRTICLVDNIFLLNYHAVTQDIHGEFDIEIVMQKGCGIASSVYNMRVSINSFFHLPNTDLCAIRVLQAPPRGSIIDYFYPKRERTAKSPGFYCIKQSDGDCSVESASVIHDPQDLYVLQLKSTYITCVAITDSGLEIGDCGSPLIAQDGKMRSIVGLHMMGQKGNTRAVSHFVNKPMIQDLLELFPIQIQCADPIMECSLRSVKLIDLHQKSVFRFIPDGNAHIYGSTDTIRPNMSSTVENSYMAEYLLNKGFEIRFTKPILNGYKIWRNAALDLLYPPTGFNIEILEICAKSYYADVRTLLPESELRLLEPYTLDVAMNGSDSVRFVDKINRNTSAGFPRFESKRKYIEDINDDDVNDQRVTPTKEIMDEFNILHANALDGKRNNIIFVVSPKDEPVSFTKAESFLVRMFAGSPFSFTLLMRVYFLSICRVIMRNRFAFESMVGTIAQSCEWSDLYKYLTQFSSNNLAAGDFKKFDKTTICSILYFSFKILIRLCEDSGNYSKKQIRAMWSIAYDVIYALYFFNGDIVSFMNGNPSGHVLTVIINCCVNSIYMRYVFFKKHPFNRVEEFRKYVALATYGDDNAMNIHKYAAPWFNHTTIQNVLSDCGITYTMADKTSESIPLIHVGEVDFLKRKWRYEPQLDAYLAPLDLKSIEKSLMVWNRSKTISKEDQSIAIISSVIREGFFHGREKFDYFTNLLKDMIRELGLSEYVRNSTFPTWDQCVEDYEVMSNTIRRIHPKYLDMHSYYQEYYDMDAPGPVRQGPLNQNAASIDSDCQMQINTKTHTEEWINSTNSPECSSKSLFRENDEIGRFSSGVTILESSELSLQSQDQLAETTSTNTTSDPLRSVGVANTTTEQVNVGISDTNAGGINDMSVKLDSSFLTGHNPDVDLESYLRRPVLIKTFDWTTSADIGVTPFFPWELYFNNASIKKKLDNYSLMNCKLHIKVQVSSTPFLYGSCRFTYQPLQLWNSNDIHETIGYQGHLVGYSQRPFVDLSPQSNSGGEMVLPFLYHKDWLEIGTLSNLTYMGQIKPITYASLQSANGATSEVVNVQVFAWAEDIKLAGPTVNAVLQSADEYKQLGPISGPATAISQASGALSSVPYIGRYATATSMAMSGVASIAKLFGYTNVPNTSSANPFKNVPFPHITSPEISGPVEKLTYDPKNELSIDSSIVGINQEDPLAISTFVARESWIWTNEWSDASAVNDILFISKVTPQLLRVDGSANFRYQMTPMSLLNNMFSYWRGNIVFKFKIICSRYHRGKLRISWDPYGDIATVSDSITTVFTKIVDIAEENEFEICIPYKQATQWQNTDSTLQENFTNDDSLVRDASTDNGLLSVRVFTRLTAPVASPVVVLVYAKGGDELEFAAPKDVPRTLSLFPVQSADEEVKDNLEVASYHAGKNSLPHPSRYLICQGESVKSLRQVLRRSTYNYSTANGGSGTSYGFQFSEFVLPRQPLFYGYDTGSTGIGTTGILAPGVTYPANFANNAPYHLIVPCFVGMRGSYNWHFNFDNENLSSTIIVERNKQSSTTIAVSATALAAAANHSQIDHFQWLRRSAANGGAILANLKTQTGMSVQAPMYSRHRMIPTSPYRMWSSTDGAENYLDKLRVKILIHPNVNDGNTSADNSALQSYFSIGTDFNVYYFLNVPTFSSYTLPTP